ncbi:hypothetical protein GJ697_02545 [Pseudoduganella sp. FT25W]|uniref:Uncharacterized protein n=1 Tax=Duganella alba TaxID=2666081 RepID=A0A6L5QAH3_9BURK|nr:hypothetical protein [Duganella alba]MRX18491.1 hypothetical protein [Duganella alba]
MDSASQSGDTGGVTTGGVTTGGVTTGGVTTGGSTGGVTTGGVTGGVTGTLALSDEPPPQALNTAAAAAQDKTVRNLIRTL